MGTPFIIIVFVLLILGGITNILEALSQDNHQHR